MKESWFAQHIHGDRELTFLFCGRQDSSPGELAGPAVREHYVLYFCLEGRGSISSGTRTALSARERASWFRPGKWSPFGLTRRSPGSSFGWASPDAARRNIWAAAAWGRRTGPFAAMSRSSWSAVSRRWSAVRCWAGAMNFFCLESCTAFWAGSPALLRGRAAGAGKPGLSM